MSKFNVGDRVKYADGTGFVTDYYGTIVSSAKIGEIVEPYQDPVWWNIQWIIPSYSHPVFLRYPESLLVSADDPFVKWVKHICAEEVSNGSV